MIKVRSQFLQLTLSAITFFVVIGVLSMIWPVILTIFLGVLLLIQSLSAEPEVAVLSWAEVGNLPVVVALLRQTRSSGAALVTRSRNHRLLRTFRNRG